MACDMVVRPVTNVLGLCAGVGGLELGIMLGEHLRGGDARGICYVEREAIDRSAVPLQLAADRSALDQPGCSRGVGTGRSVRNGGGLMPISPQNAARYPTDWSEISRRIRFERAGGRCECQGECGHDHAGRCAELNGEAHSITGSPVVLTVGHIHHDLDRSGDEDLRAWCQRCHLAYDQPHHIQNLRRTHSLRRIAAAGTLDLFDGDLGDRTRQPIPLPVVAPIAPTVLPAWPFGDLVPHRYRVILADFPWYFRNRTAAGEVKNPVAHYSCMSIEDLARLPIARLAAPDCVLVMWATAPLLDRAIELMKGYGFTFKSAGAWAKQSRTGEKWTFGTGYIFRSAAEFYLVGTIGKPRVLSHSIRNLIAAPVREHSRKPAQLHDDLERLYAGPRCELFARAPRAGWDVWGNQTDRFADEA